MAINRRNFMQQSAVWAAAFASGTVPAMFRGALAARETELNILCWEGYNSAQVLDPFRTAHSATVKAESLTNDPTMINRLRAGETNVWDLINVNNPWARKVMYPEGLIKPLDRATIRALFRQDDAGLQAALPLGDERGRQGAARHVPALRAVQLRRQYRQDQPRDRRGRQAGICSTIPPMPANTASSKATTGTSSTSASSPASIRSRCIPTTRWRSSPRPRRRSSATPSWSATSPP